MFINDSYFRNNSGHMGGVFYVFGNREGKSNFVVHNSVFVQNMAYLGGAIGFFSSLKALNGLLLNNSFVNNFGSSFYLNFLYLC